ncbi:MAG: class I SAM-dependent methyltransferase [Planctomycetes bacterium]|nr:class I SAM-dependent methyltransferase [Planctomycetota bacterium]
MLPRLSRPPSRLRLPLLYDIPEIQRHYRRILEDKPKEYYERFDPTMLERRPLVAALVDRVFARVFPKKVPLLLDVGCGTGFYYPLLAKYADRLVGVDVCVPMLDLAKELIRSKGLKNVEVRESSAFDLPFGEASVDGVLSFDFLHHAPGVPQAAAEIHRVLKPGGRYTAFEPNILNPSIAWYHLRRRNEWGLYARNRFTVPRIFRKRFAEVRLLPDNTIISYLSPRTLPIYNALTALTRIPPFHLLTFRYILSATKAAAPR